MQKMWKSRDELSPRNFRTGFLSMFLVFPLTIIIGDLRFLDQALVTFGLDSNNFIMMIFGLGFLPMLFMKERHMLPLLRVSVLVQAVLLILQFFMEPGILRLIVFLGFHAANGLCTACCFYLFAFVLNNVERLFTLLIAQLYYGLNYLLWQFEPIADFFRIFGSAALMLALIVVVFSVRKLPQSDALDTGMLRMPATPPETKMTEAGLSDGKKVLSAWDSGIAAIIALNMIYYVITLMSMYIAYQEQTVSAALYGVGGLVSVALILIIMLIFNYSALHLWSLCLVCSVLGIGALHYASIFAVNTGSLLYGIGEGLGFMIIYYLLGGALKRSASFRLLRLCCLFACVNYVVISGVFDFLYDHLRAPNLALAFPAVLVLMLICFLFSPLLQDKLFRTDWTDGYHMADIPLYAEAFRQTEQLDKACDLGLTPREMEIFTMLLTEASPKQIAATLRVSYATVNFHSKNLYRKLDIQSRTELFAQYGGL
jgi:DNA-binding CsgD family transcriptional regulator